MKLNFKILKLTKCQCQALPMKCSNNKLTKKGPQFKKISVKIHKLPIWEQIEEVKEMF
jgi:hypothetical protein